MFKLVRSRKFGIKHIAIAVALICIPQLSLCQELKVVSYNIWGLPSPLIRHPERFQEFPNAINSLDADVVLIQEAFTQRAQALTHLSKFPYHSWGPSSRFGRFSSGLLILSRFPIAETATTTYSKCGGFDCFANKGVLFSRILLLDNTSVNVFDTHMNANGHESVRMSQAGELIQFVWEHSRGLPTIVAGDFNGDRPVFLQTLTRTLSAREAHAEFMDQHPVLTPGEIHGFTADAQRNPFLSRSEPSYRLDHVFLVNGLTGPSWKVLDDGLVFDGKNGKILSDHFGVHTVVDL